MIPLLLPLLAGRASTTTAPMTMHTVVDDTAIHGVAYRYIAPKGWVAKATVTWQSEISSPTALTAFAASPDERFGYLILQGQDFHFFVKNGGMWVNVMTQGTKQGVTPPNRLSDFLVDQVKALFKLDIHVTKREDHPLTGAALPKYRNLGQVGHVEFTFTDAKGRACTGVIAAMMDGNLVGDTVHAGMSYQGDWRIENLFLISAPMGEEKTAMRFFSIAAPTYTPTKAFIRARGAYQMVLNHQIDAQIANAGEISRITSRMNGKIEDAIMGRYHTEQAADNKQISAFCDYIGDVQRSRNLDGTELQTNSKDGQPWADGKGGIAFGDNPGSGWTRLKKMGD